MIARIEEGDRGIWVRGDKGATRFVRAMPGVLAARVDGVLDESHVRAWSTLFEQEISRAGSLALMADCTAGIRTDAGFRDPMIAFGRSHKKNFRVLLVSSSRLFDLTVSLASLALGSEQIRSFSSVSSWEAECARICPGFKRSLLDMPTNANAR